VTTATVQGGTWGWGACCEQLSAVATNTDRIWPPSQQKYSTWVFPPFWDYFLSSSSIFRQSTDLNSNFYNPCKMEKTGIMQQLVSQFSKWRATKISHVWRCADKKHRRPYVYIIGTDQDCILCLHLEITEINRARRQVRICRIWKELSFPKLVLSDCVPACFRLGFLRVFV
jgi:hypothetical protein